MKNPRENRVYGTIYDYHVIYKFVPCCDELDIILTLNQSQYKIPPEKYLYPYQQKLVRIINILSPVLRLRKTAQGNNLFIKPYTAE